MNSPTFHRQTKGGFTLVEIMIVVAILGIILAIAGSTWIKQRELSQKRSCQENLSKIDGAKEQWALNNQKAVSETPIWDDLVQADGSGYIKKTPVCPGEGVYELGSLNQVASCSIVAPQNHNEN